MQIAEWEIYKLVNYRKEAKGRDCQIRIPSYCNFNPETTVLCHLPGAGMGRKHDDRHGAHGCSCCHDVVDFRVQTEFTPTEIKLMHYEGVIRTQQILISEGKL